MLIKARRHVRRSYYLNTRSVTVDPKGTNQGLGMGRPLCSTCMDRVDRVLMAKS